MLAGYPVLLPADRFWQEAGSEHGFILTRPQVERGKRVNDAAGGEKTTPLMLDKG